VQNTSPSSTTATSIAITDPLPTTLTFVAVDNVTYSAGGSNASAPVHNGTNPGGTVSVTIDELPASSTATFRIRATIN
ncbi:MAG: hypothetical protein JJU24_19335, partial [Natronohydrobacter sp.]|nr:hypothetical protein [Natronohydrobacter sp.]